ncbi:hypothetical protein DVB69_05220 [Sporosarcina sp. BI001-red]|uniref:hypothetical protein n=1 Tax=Sporosarcina sp. BI001-red TaxID=2282866 RepID=UPI000E231B4D|nr:hypothetical protein [Sporosarcina sp. BI001-red]REB08540.1 hypothetical protein DVB69_05220 [Sporosarcina sp. BI001-red]
MTSMIRSMKSGMSLLLACVLLLGVLAPAVSAATPTWSESIAPKTTKDVNKVWTVTYSDTIDASTVSADNVRVVTESGTPVKTDAIVEGKTILVVPVESYMPGKYLLYVGPGIHSTKGKLQKADIKFSFVVASETEQEGKTQVIQSIKEDSVQIGGQQYTVTPQLKELFSVANQDALKNASVTFTASETQVTEVQDLHLVNGGEQAAERVLQGGEGKITGNLYVESDYYHVSHLAVQGDVLFSEIVTESFTADHLTVEGTVAVPETVQTAVQTFAEYPTTRMTIVFQDSSIAVIEIRRKDTYVQGIGNTQVTSVAIMANSELYFDTNVILPNVKISKGVTYIDLNATIKNVVIESNNDIQITGSGDFENVTVSTNKTVDFSAKGSIGNLNMENGTGTVELGNELNVSNVTLPPGKMANEVISNFEEVKEKI